MNKHILARCAAAACAALMAAGCARDASRFDEATPAASGSYRIFKQTYYRQGKFREYHFYESDSAGNTFSESIQRSDGLLHGATKRYKKEGDTVKVLVYDNQDNLKSYVVQEYDPVHKNIVKLSNYDKNDRLRTYITFEYDAAGTLMKKSNFDAAGKPTGYQFEFDKNGNLVKDSYYEAGALRRYSVHEYDAQNNLVKRTRFDGQGRLDSYKMFTYNDRGMLAEHQNYSASSALLWNMVSSYDAAGRRVKVQYFEREGGGMGLKFTKEFTYDDKGNLAKVATYDRAGNITGSGVYKYDAKGNKTRQEYFDERNELLGFSIYDYDMQ
ncbi:MAG TPA: hypothetical protein PLE73_00865 [Spirochaetota bacterium]|nr:hypothetical protein [Spirochaetota bacterium]HPI21717.1 hypothetical protein [Spirochaetota bacterium]HPU86833.1 hypothetical protein [Spirochaetota bacterium]